MAGLNFPVSTLHPSPHENRRMTRGQTGTLSLVCAALASTTYLRLLPALSLTRFFSCPKPDLSNKRTLHYTYTIQQ